MSQQNAVQASKLQDARGAVSTSDIRVFVGVLSRSGNSATRQTIRTTWGVDKQIAKLMFFVLRPQSDAAFLKLRREAVASGDVFVTSDVYEHYSNITYSVLSIFKAAATHGQEAFTHVVKTDEDCYMRSNLVISALQQMPRSWLYAGWPMEFGSVVRTQGWRYVPFSNWPGDHPVRYGFGAGYALSMDLVMEIATGAAHIIMPAHNLLIIEDIAVGYWVRQVRKERHVRVTYNSSLTMSDECTPDAYKPDGAAACHAMYACAWWSLLLGRHIQPYQQHNVSGGTST